MVVEVVVEPHILELRAVEVAQVAEVLVNLEMPLEVLLELQTQVAEEVGGVVVLPIQQDITVALE